METVMITGGTGLIGRALTKELVSRGYNVMILTRGRSTAAKRSGVQYAHWDVERQSIDKDAVAQADHLVHLAGANVAEGRWTEARKREIVESRTKSGTLLVRALKEYPNSIKTVVSASAIGWYGSDPQVPNQRPFTESAPADRGFLGATCRQWEDSISGMVELGKRLVILRTGIVLSTEGGAYKEFEKPLRFGVASVLGNGKQVVSWIHIADLVGMYMMALQNERWQGVYNAVAPAPVSNRELIATIAKQRGKFYITTKVPEAALKVALGEMSIEVLKSATVSGRKAEEAGYRFLFPNIGTAVHNLVHKK
ncbi:MAG TPA: TIGR01777 family oxidoreductase [Chitinophagaceae bacterium]